jgi:hypothetical protein
MASHALLRGEVPGASLQAAVSESEKRQAATRFDASGKTGDG